MDIYHRLVAALIVTGLLAGCGGSGTKPQVAEAPPRAQGWQNVIRDSDRRRLAGLWSAWTRSLAQAETAGQLQRVAALGDMAVPDAARPAPAPRPGAYRCRTVRIGIRDSDAALRAVAGTAPVMLASGFLPCTIAARAGRLWFEQGIGLQRVAGTLYPDGDRQVFLGSMALAGEAGFRSYGADPDRDQVGVLRAFGDRRWRLELPWPMWQSNLAIIEIVSG